MKLVQTIGVALVASLLSLGCQTPAEQAAPSTADSADASGTLGIQPETVLPAKFTREFGSPSSRDLSVPATMLAVTKVTRPKAELRAGPGVQFELGDALLPHGTPVICFDRVGVWQRVVVPGTWQRGWVHHQALSPPQPSAQPIVIPSRVLPTVLAVHPIASVMSYPRREALKVDIPTGAMFRSLNQNNGRVLVWMQETNSVMWVGRHDVQ